MSFFIKIKTNTTNCIAGCVLFNDDNNFSYWEDKRETADEKFVYKYLNGLDFLENKRILHIGVGNSYIARNLKKFKNIDGITLSNSELHFAKELNINKYNIFFQNKYSNFNILCNDLNNYDIIIDVNIKSFSCCDSAFRSLFKKYSEMLNNNGTLIIGRDGMKWSRLIKPVISFSFKNLFYKRLKEFDGPKSNYLNENDCLDLASKYNLDVDKTHDKLILFKK